MIRGVVNDRREAILRLCLKRPEGTKLDVDVIVDTGFTSSLTLPTSLIASLGLVRPGRQQCNLGRWFLKNIRHLPG